MPSRTRIKICGLKSIENAKLAADCGADSIGLVFHRPSSRFIDVEMATEIRQALPAFVSITALFLNESERLIEQVIEKVRPDYLQFHGTESAEFCESWNHSYIKAIPMGSAESVGSYAQKYDRAQGFLLDSNVAGRLGGSGDTFDWSKIPSTFQFPLILAGGLSPQNVAEAITRVRPWAVDVSSGVEKEKGVKDARLIMQFCKEVIRVDCQK